MASYTSRTYEERRTIQRLWEAGVQVKEIADKLNAPYPPSTRNRGAVRTGAACRTGGFATMRTLPS